MVRKVLAIYNALCENLGTLEELFVNDKYTIEKVYAVAEELPVNIDKYSGIIILGGPMSVYDNLQYIQKEIELIKKAIEKDILIIGICLGSQIIAKSIGGNVFNGDFKEIGWKKISITEEGSREIFKGIEKENIDVFQWHGDTFTLPSSATILSKSEQYIQAFKIKKAIGIQFHCEVNEQMIEEFVNEYKEELANENIHPNSLLVHDTRKIKDLRNICLQLYHNIKTELE